VETRRELLRAMAAALPIGATLTLAGRAYGLSREEMPAALAKQYRDHCGADPFHAATLEAAFARLDAAGVTYDRAEVAASLRCPICGCSIISGPFQPEGTHQAPPSP
jgi:hypothetical protein